MSELYAQTKNAIKVYTKHERVPSLDPVQQFEFPASDILQAEFHFSGPEDRTSQNVLD